MTPARFRWGMLLIQIGILILLQNNDIISDVAWEGLIVLFPIVLIAVGIEKIFTKSRLQFISYLTTLALFFGGFAIAFSTSGVGFQNDNFFSDSIYKEEADSNLQQIKATLHLEQNNLTIRDSGSELILAEFDEFSRKPLIETTINDDIALINFEARDNSFFGGAVKIHSGEAQDWDVRFSENLPLELKCTGFDNDLHLNFLTSRLQKLNLDTDNSSIYLKIGSNEPYVQISIQGEDSKLRLRVPEKIGMKIFGNDSSFFNQLGFEKSSDGSFINDNYNSSDLKIDLDIDDRLISFSLDYF